MTGNNHQTKISFQADGTTAVEHPAHPKYQQQPVHRGRQVHQRGPQGPLRCPQKLSRGQPTVKEFLRSVKKKNLVGSQRSVKKIGTSVIEQKSRGEKSKTKEY